ncbi:MAG: PQQ-binding-like beta-propeller repeat protein [Planctomycetales bacterium]|nr:PQQ-binding-like beta-propeller repeat protein [Planctomycetales bacterium]
MRLIVPLCLFALLVGTHQVGAQHRLITQGNDQLVIVGANGQNEWAMKWGGIHDIHVQDGRVMLQRGAAGLAEIDLETKQVVWSYDSATQNGNAGRPVEVHAFQPLGDDRIMIAESGPGRIIEINRAGELLKEISLKVEHPHPHTDTRLVRKLSTGNYLVCHEGDGTVREYNGETGDVVWEYPVPLFGKRERPGHGPEAYGNKCFAAVRLANGNTLISTGNGHGVIEVTPDKQIAWQIQQHDLPKITLAWVTTLEVLENGHYIIGNCHAGPGQPLLIELDPQTKQVVWTFDQFDRLGNSVSNSQLLDVKAMR